jgi:hypothetical protein
VINPVIDIYRIFNVGLPRYQDWVGPLARTRISQHQCNCPRPEALLRQLRTCPLCGNRKNRKRQASLPDTLDARVRDTFSSHSTEASRKDKCILGEDKMTPECEPTYGQKRPEDGRRETKPQDESVRPASTHKSHHDQPCKAAAEEYVDQRPSRIIGILAR